MVQKRIDYELVLFLLRGGLHLREISRKLGESHSTVMRKLNELVDEGVLDYKVEGRNKLFFLRKNLQARSYVYGAEGYKMKKLIGQYPKLGIILEDVYKKIGGKMVLVFGSYAKFIAKKKSDIDIYVETTSRSLKRDVEGVNSMISVKIGKFNKSSNLMREIIRNHVVLKGVEKFYEKLGFFE